METKKLKYFCKYLPVEGKYEKKTDLFIFKIGGVWSEPCYADDLLGNQIEEVKKVKLFLCLRHTECPSCEEKENLHDNLDYSKEELPIIETLCNECGTLFDYKKIGEISPDAIWVNEGMEFDDDELLKTIIYKYREPENNIPLHVEPLEGCIVNNTFIKIKCPTCKTYH